MLEDFSMNGLLPLDNNMKVDGEVVDNSNSSPTAPSANDTSDSNLGMITPSSARGVADTTTMTN